MTRGAIFAACRGENDYFVADYWRTLTFASVAIAARFVALLHLSLCQRLNKYLPVLHTLLVCYLLPITFRFRPLLILLSVRLRHLPHLRGGAISISLSRERGPIRDSNLSLSLSLFLRKILRIPL